ncbi:response regulator [Christensenellaceae bacterium OttesenSCG-928-L17]|nr:response regulator [Christensenellaceae bacterium OttesenSCG-928-L17]
MDKKILVIDDSQFFRTQINMILTNAGYTVITTGSGEEGLKLVQLEKPDLALLDVVMPDMDGFEVCRILRDHESNNLMPIIMLTSKDDQDDKLVGLELGADDYITKPFNERELLSRIRNTLRRIDRNRSANPLTGLNGNLEIQREINSRIARKEPFAVVYIDLDNFKSFNDVYGFAKGDMAIKLTADILLEQVRLFGNSNDFVGHIGGDDFVFITTPDKAADICKECILQFDEKIRLLFSKEDVERGYIISVNRRGVKETFGITSISMGIVTNELREFESHLQVSTIASELKKKLKATPGSCYMFDRRKD